MGHLVSRHVARLEIVVLPSDQASIQFIYPAIFRSTYSYLVFTHRTENTAVADFQGLRNRGPQNTLIDIGTCRSHMHMSYSDDNNAFYTC